MNKRKIAILLTLSCIFILIMIGTIIELNNIEKEKQYNYVVKQIESATIKCVRDKKCEMGKITMKKLIDEKYIEEQINPKTNEKINEKSYMIYPELSFYIEK